MSYTYLPVCIPFRFKIVGKLKTLSNESKWFSPWCSPYIPFWCEGIPVRSAARLKWNLYRLKYLKYLFCDLFVVPWRAAAHRSVGVVEDETFLRQTVQVRGLANFVSVGSHFETPIISWKIKSCLTLPLTKHATAGRVHLKVLFKNHCYFRLRNTCKVFSN